MGGSKFLCALLLAIGLGFVTCSTGLAAVNTTGSISDDGGSSYSNIFIGYAGDGTLSIDAGSTLTRHDGYLGFLTGFTGTATVTGLGSIWNNYSTLIVGNSGNGTLNVQSGGLVHSNGGYLGYQFGSTGAATVTGSGSAWTNGGPLYVGNSGCGTLNVQAGAQVSNWGAGYLGYNSGSTGTAMVTGAGSIWTSGGSFYVGF